MISDATATLEAQKQMQDGEQDPKPTIPPVARNLFDQLFLPIELQQAYWTAVNGVLWNSSIAYQIDRNLQRMMRYDAGLMAPWYSVQMAVATAPMKVTPRNPKNEIEKAVAKFVTTALEDIPSWTDYKIWLAECGWWGRSGCMNVYERRNGGILPRSWKPIHPDTFCCNFEGRLGVKIGPKYLAQPGVVTTTGPESLVHMFSETDRESITFAKFRPTGNDFWEGMQTEYAHLGMGLRDVVWFCWKLHQHVLQNWGIYTQRYGQGLRKVFYPEGNATARTEMQTAAANAIGDVSIMIPDDGQTTRRKADIEVHEPSSATADTFLSLVERLEAKMKELISGQTATSEATSSGLGGGVANEHARTKADHVDYLADIVGEAISNDLVAMIVRMNFGEEIPPPRVKFQVRRPEPEKFIASVKAILEMGGEVAQEDVYEFVGVRQPDPGEPTFKKPEELGLVDLPNLRHGQHV